MSSIPDEFIRHGHYLLADGGYNHSQLICTRRFTDGSGVRKEMCNLRAIVETALGVVSNFRVSGGRFRGSPFLQTMCVVISYELTQWKMMRSILRPHHLPPALKCAFETRSLDILQAPEAEVARWWSQAHLQAIREGSEDRSNPEVPGCRLYLHTE